MGNAESAAVHARLARFRPHERPVIEKVFDRVQERGAGNSGKVLTLDTLKVCIGDVVSASMVSRLFRGMHSVDGGTAAPAGGGVTREQLLVFLADALRGTAQERAPLIMAMARAGEDSLSITQIREFLEDLISAVLHIFIHRNQLQGWKPECMGDSDAGVKLLAEQLTSELKCKDGQVCDIPCVEEWLFRMSTVSHYLEFITNEGLAGLLLSQPPLTFLPPCRDTPWHSVRSMLDLPLLLFLSPQLPDRQDAPWRLLFSSRLHGESFTRFVGNCIHKGPTVLLVRESGGHMFGGFASHSWDTKPQFQGDSRCFLFSVFPHMRVYTCTGYNQHYMYLNQGQQTMPNGLGMGGQHYYFGLWLDSDFGRGHSRARPRCTTYGSPQLSSQEDFVLDNVEVWGVGDPPEEHQTRGKKSVLDVDPEAQAIMEMTGKTLHSQGLREPEDDES